ncbi:MAG: zinc-binding dehydrogenase [Chloroflexota bacterium]|jgi:L-iditol 2-dehydrogenase|nr:zinc-binding dehydrogenase [Dehalococcoidia bacterium]MEC9014159.1 zinc-binding dehydrogenase [Chloroflexota bacterium]MED5207710.1 zinc-binding dehydrogenase [Chloroflexota bacterium]MEE3013478.1 zinc-binding dehydrogenase [Chloroflexota bacterium]GIS94611.1 MAG: alcohol dehydrogenase [Dehalococcoidia bacterium]|tara:strand:- start:9548 stop:10516 length:969 start_codon:yes stop_codon:yes gene_type:complete
MRAARLAGPKHFEFIDTDMPVAGDGECLIKLERVSVCGSDCRHGFNIHPEEEYPMEPGRPCHELAGVIVESRTDEYREGQRVIAIPARGSGGLMEYMTSDPSRMILLPDEGPLDEWVMCQPSGTVLYSCQQMPNILGKNVVIMGQGSIGLSFAMITSRMGASNVAVVDPLDYRLEKSKHFGSTHQINPDKENVDEAVLDITDGVGPDVIVEASGYPGPFNDCFRLVRQFGTIMVFGVQADDFVPVEHNYIMDKQPRMIGTTGARSGDPTTQIKHMVALRQRGWCEPADLITHRMDFSDVQKAYDMYDTQQDEIIKVIIDINK